MGTIDVLKKMHRTKYAKVYIVGGFVRDLILNKNNNDLDIVIRESSRIRIIKFLRKYGKVKSVTLSQSNNEFTVTTVLFKAFNGEREAQITLPKKGKKQIAKSYNSLKDDYKHRDFRINCLYLPITAEQTIDNVIDMAGGIDDLKRRILVANGDPYERIKESPIRMLRAISLAARLNFSIDIDLLNAISDCSKLLNHVLPEAVKAEFNKILMSDKPSKYLKLLQRLGLLPIISHELSECIGVSQDKRYHKYDVFDHLIYTCDNTPKNLILRLAGLFHDVGKPKTRYQIGWHGKITFHKHEIESAKETEAFFNRLKYDNTTKREVLNLIKMHMYYYTNEWTDAAVRRFIRKAKLDHTYLKKMSKFPLFILRASERLGNGFKKIPITDRQISFEKRIKEILVKTTVLDIKDLLINGSDIKNRFKISQGKEVGKMLRYVFNEVLKNQTLNTKPKLLKMIETKFIRKEKKS